MDMVDVTFHEKSNNIIAYHQRIKLYDTKSHQGFKLSSEVCSKLYIASEWLVDVCKVSCANPTEFRKKKKKNSCKKKKKKKKRKKEHVSRSCRRDPSSGMGPTEGDNDSSINEYNLLLWSSFHRFRLRPFQTYISNEVGDTR